MTDDLYSRYSKEIQQEKFAALVSARVNDILSGNAKVLAFEESGGIFSPAEQDALLFADTIARMVCANLNQK